jgi:hypothetical protein
MNDIGGFGPRSTNQKVVRFNVSVDEVLLVDSLDSRELLRLVRQVLKNMDRLTICFATMTTVFVENLRLQ